MTKKYLSVIMLSFMIALIITGCTKSEFNGNRVSNSNQFLLGFTVLNCTKSHEMELEKGSKTKVSINKESGNIAILISGKDENVIYKSDDAESWEFTVTVPKTDTYTFNVTGEDAKGSVSFEVEN